MPTMQNARVQLLATGLNNLGVGAIPAGVAAPLVNGTPADFAQIASWIALGRVALPTHL